MYEPCVDFLGSITERDDMWRYQRLLPVKNIVSAGEGNTPIIFLADLSKKLGINLYAKLESTNPTGTFKDREASFVVSRSLDVGDDNLVMQSTGNTAVAITHYAGLAGLSSYCFIPKISMYKLRMPEKGSKNRLIAVDGTPIQVKEYAAQFAKVFGFPKISPFHERCECNVTQAYEVYEKVLRGEVPGFDHYVQVISAGMGPIGFFLGAKRLAQWYPGRIRIPRIHCVQNSEFSPMDAALKERRETLGEEGKTPTYPTDDPFEPTLHTTNAPAYYPYVRMAIEESGGSAPMIDPDVTEGCAPEFRDALTQQGYGLAETENAALIGYAGLVQLVGQGVIGKGSNVILMVTGKGSHVSHQVEPDAIIDPDYDVQRLMQDLGGESHAGHRRK